MPPVGAYVSCASCPRAAFRRRQHACPEDRARAVRARRAQDRSQDSPIVWLSGLGAAALTSALVSSGPFHPPRSSTNRLVVSPNSKLSERFQRPRVTGTTRSATPRGTLHVPRLKRIGEFLISSYSRADRHDSDATNRHCRCTRPAASASSSRRRSSRGSPPQPRAHGESGDDAETHNSAQVRPERHRESRRHGQNALDPWKNRRDRRHVRDGRTPARRRRKMRAWRGQQLLRLPT
jgi:hypothetical protein